MKRDEIKVGDELAYVRGRSEWTQPEKVVVMAIEPSERIKYGAKRGEIVTCPKGHGVHVKREGGYHAVVPLGSLKGPWEQVKADFEARDKARDERRDRLNSERQRNEADADELVARAKALGITGHIENIGGWSSTERYIRLTRDGMRALLTLAELASPK
jgi:hypothetical protein